MNKTAILFIALAFIFAGCSQTEKEQQPLTKRVILIGSDGFGAYAFEKTKVPNLRKLMAGGAYSLMARAVLPSSSAVNWASMITGSSPELHGYTEWGSKTPEISPRMIGRGGIYPTIFSVIDFKAPEAKMGVSYTWGGIGYLFEKELVDLDFNGGSDEESVGKALDFIVNEKPMFTFLHMDEPDHAGHDIGHDTPEYYKAVEKIDSLVGGIISTLEQNGMMEETTIIFTSDHGGIEKGHGGKTLLEVEIPWIIYGAGIPAKGQLKSSIVTYDTGATIAHLLGLDIPDFWRGKPVKEVFERPKAAK